MKKDDLAEWIIANGKYLLTVRDDTFKINFYQVNADHWEIYFNVKLNRVTRAGQVTRHGLRKYLSYIKVQP